ncbi:MAG: hypothetical protein GY851_28075 [bacterium]|nr:hypothetical protein [bacterium]
MLYLMISIAGLAGLAVCLRAGVGRGASPLGMYTVFRGVAVVILLVGSASAISMREIPDLISQTWVLCLIGAPSAWFAGFAATKAVQHGHLGISWTVLRCAMLVPTLASLLVWREMPLYPIHLTLVMRIGGVAATTTALLLMGYDRARAPSDKPAGAGSRWVWVGWMAVAYVSQGTFETCVVVTRYLPSHEGRAFFLTVSFGAAFLCSIPLVALTGARIARREWTWGLLAGVCSVAGSAGRMWAVHVMGGLIVFPVTTVAVVFLVQFAGIALWRERMGRWGIVGFVAAVAGVLLLSLQL